MSATKNAAPSSQGEFSTFQLLRMSQQSNSSSHEGGGGSAVKPYVPLRKDPQYEGFIDLVDNAGHSSNHAPPPSSSAARSQGGSSTSRNKR